MRPKTLSKYLAKAIRNNWPVLLTGASGVGKTDVIIDAVKAAGADLILSHPVVADPTDFKGLPFPTTEGRAEFLPYGDLYQLAQAKKKTVFVMDDIGQAAVAVQAALMQLILSRQINGVRVNNNVVFIAATNRAQDMAGVGRFLAPLKSRFYGIIPFDVDVDDWIQWAMLHDMPAELIAFAKVKHGIFAERKPSKDIVNEVSPRTLAHVGEQQNAGLDPDEEAEVFAGAAGAAFAAEYTHFLTACRQLPNPDSIIADPRGALVPTDPAQLYAITGGLARKMTDRNMGAIIAYLNRTPAEFAVYCMTDATRRNQDLTSSREYSAWAIAHQKHII
jgi:hypothetical protein